MTEEEYWGEVKRIGLTPTCVQTVFQDSLGMTYNVPDPARYSPEHRRKIIRELKSLVGISS
jgi:hypothetical protein